MNNILINKQIIRTERWKKLFDIPDQCDCLPMWII